MRKKNQPKTKFKLTTESITWHDYWNMHILAKTFSSTKPSYWPHWKLLTNNAVAVRERLVRSLTLSNTLKHISPNACIAKNIFSNQSVVPTILFMGHQLCWSFFWQLINVQSILHLKWFKPLFITLALMDGHYYLNLTVIFCF